MKRPGRLLFLGISFLMIIIILAYAQGAKADEKAAPPASAPAKLEAPSVSTKIHDLEARLPVSTRRPISGSSGVFILKGKVCNVGTVDHVSPPAAPAYAQLIAEHSTATGVRKVVLDTQRVTRLNRGQCLDIRKDYEVPGIVRWGRERPGPGECGEEVSFWVVIGRDPSTPGRTYSYDYPDSNTGNNIAGHRMDYTIRCPR